MNLNWLLSYFWKKKGMKITGGSECIIIYPEQKSSGSDILKQAHFKNQLSTSIKCSEIGSQELVGNRTFSLGQNILEMSFIHGGMKQVTISISDGGDACHLW